MYYTYIGDDMINILKIRHDFPEKSGFHLKRPNGHRDYVFLHFITPVSMVINGKEIDIKSGACVLFTPKTPYFFKSEGNLLHNWFHSDASVEEFIREYGIPVNTPFYPKETKFISHLFYLTEIEFFSCDELKHTMINALMTQFFCTLHRELNGTQERVPLETADKLRLIRQKILSEPESHLSVSEMARFIGLSPSRFHSLYRLVFGTTPVKDSIFARIEYAKTLLLNENISVSEVAERAGYTDQYHFIRQFKKETGITPAKYRKGL